MKKIFLLATATAALMACSNNDEPLNNEPIAARIIANINGASSTRAAGTQWGTGDEIGVTSGSGTSYANVKYATTDGGSNFTGGSIYFPDAATNVTFTAYYPFSGTSGTVPGTDGVITNDTKATNQTATNQPKIDYLWATQSATGENPNVTFQFAHKMSKLTLKFVQGNDVTISQVTQYSLSGLVLEGTFNTTNGTAAAKTEGTTATDLVMNVSNVTSDSEYSLILYPQTITGGVTLSITCDNLTYNCPLKVNNSDLSGLAAGSNYTFTITVSKKGLTITNSTISDWTAVSGDAGTAYPG